MLTLRRAAAGLAIAAALGAAATPALCADAAAPAPNAQNLELAKRLFSDMHMDQMMSGMMKSMGPGLIAQMRQGNSSLTDAQAQAIGDAITKSTAVMMNRMMERMAPLYASTFSQKELQDLVDFYEGPSGKAMLEKMPVLMAKMTPMVLELMPEMQADMRQRLCAVTECPATPAAPKS